MSSANFVCVTALVTGVHDMEEAQANAELDLEDDGREQYCKLASNAMLRDANAEPHPRIIATENEMVIYMESNRSHF